MREVKISVIAERHGIPEEKIKKDIEEGYLTPPLTGREGYVSHNFKLQRYIKSNGDTTDMPKWYGIYGNYIRSINKIIISRVFYQGRKVYVANHPDKTYKVFSDYDLAVAYCLHNQKFLTKKIHSISKYKAKYIRLNYHEMKYLLTVVPTSMKVLRNKLRKKIKELEKGE